MKSEFFKYLGSETDLSGYQRSYKLVLYKCFFERFGAEKEIAAYTISRAFQQYYLQRIQQGLQPEVNADPVIEHIDRSTPESIYGLILKNPFAAISSHGYMEKITHNGEDYFKLSDALAKELTADDVGVILQIVEKKLSLYFSKITANKYAGNLKSVVEKILNTYVLAKQEIFANHPLGSYFRSDIPKVLYSSGLVNSAEYQISGSVGQGNWAMVPWICIFDRSITNSATKGVYIAYLLSSDGKTLYLTLDQGCSELKNTHTKKEVIQIMRNNAKEIVSRINSRGFCTDEDINLGEGLTTLAELYQKGTIFYKAYHQGNVPSEEELRQDLANMMGIYAEYANKSNNTEEQIIDVREEKLSVKESIEKIKEYIAAEGFTYEDDLIENFYLSLKAKPFAILAGTSGTGKTRLVRLFAEAVGATKDNGRYKMVPVRPDWSDSSDLFGHVDLNGHFVPGAIIDFVKKAELDETRPYFLCLDEMNLARVEYYLSDILSVIETRDLTASGKIESDPLIDPTYYGRDRDAAGKYGAVRLPENLYIIGTVNMDETTFPFSRKVLDRANTIEFSFVDLLPKFAAVVDVAPAPQMLDNSFLKTEYLRLKECVSDVEDVEIFCTELQEINRILQTGNAHVGYRVRDEIVFYLLNNKHFDLMSDDEAMDHELMQKILPRIQGSSASIKNMLCELFKLCAGDYEGYQTQSDDISSKMIKALNGSRCKYKHSAEKIAFMVRRFEEDGFTSYWL